MKRLVIVLLASVVGYEARAAPHPCGQGWAPTEGGQQSARASELELDATIRSALEAVPTTPGLAVGILERGEVTYARGFGVRDLDGCAPMTPDSLFYLLSLTKSFTGMAAAVLQEQGVIELDQSLEQFFPELVAREPINLGQTSLRDLLNHRPGFWSGGINFRSFLPANLDLASMKALIANHARPAEISFAYSNVGYVVGAAAIEQATGLSWQELLDQQIFQPVGMKKSTTSIEEAIDGGDFAVPYQLSLENTFERAMVKHEKQMHAAGGAVSNVRDLLRWLEINLEGGKIDGRQVLPRFAVRQAHAPQIQYQWNYGPYRRFAYGLGVHNSELAGELVIHHFGGPIHLSFAPEHRLGIVVLSAGPDSTPLVHRLAASLYDLWLDKEAARSTLQTYLAEANVSVAERLETRRGRWAELEARRGDLSRPERAYTGTFVSDRLGQITVNAVDGEVQARFGVLELRLIALEKDVFLMEFPNRDLHEIRFDRWANGVPEVLDWGGRRFERVGQAAVDRSDAGQQPSSTVNPTSSVSHRSTT